MSVYIKYRIAGGKMKLHESDIGTEHFYDQFPGIELAELRDWHLVYNNNVYQGVRRMVFTHTSKTCRHARSKATLVG